MSKLFLLAFFVLALSQDENDLTQSDELGEKYEFQAEVASLMDIIINSLYLHKEVFLRELISNASDAMDKIKFLALLNPDKDYGSLEIRISFDESKKTLTIQDKGIGMTRNDLIEKLGTVAKSGTTQFLEAIAKGGSINLIGQFGVGFYSCFLAADKVTVISKHDDDDQWIWISSAGPQFAVKKDPRGNTLGRGTEIILELKQDAEEFLMQETIKNTVKDYSEFIDYPIFLYSQKDKWIDRPMTEQEIQEEEEKEAKKKKAEEDRKRKEREEKGITEEEQEERERAEVEEKKRREEEKEGQHDHEHDHDHEHEHDHDHEHEHDHDHEHEEEEPKEKEEKTKKDKIQVWEWEQVNAQKAIWTKDPKENRVKDYVKLYQTLKRDGSEPLYFLHFHGEGEVEFRAIVFIPDAAPSEMFDSYHKNKSGVRLYVRRVLIADGPKDLIPKYLSFLKGVIHSDDMPLNVSRENLQHQRIMRIISNKLTKKVIDMLIDLSEDKDDWKAERPEKEDYETDSDDETLKQDLDQEYQILLRWSSKSGKGRYDEFWKHYAKNIKMGIMEDSNNRAKLLKLLKFHSTKSISGLTTFEEYVERMPANQEFIYFMAGESIDLMKNSPMIQNLNKLGYEVILLDDPLDEFTWTYFKEYGDKQVKNVAKGDLDLGTQTTYEERKEVKIKELFQPLCDWWKKVLGKNVEKVTVSRRLVEDPVVISTSENTYTANMWRISKAQTYSNQQKIPEHYTPRKTLEINPSHPTIKKLLSRVEEPSKQLEDYAWLLYESALVSSGFNVIEDFDFTERMYTVLRKNMEILPSEPIVEPEIVIPEDEPLEDEEEIENLDEPKSSEEEIEDLDEPGKVDL
jgi:heat shock protein beta